MSDNRFTVLSTSPTTYNDPVLGIVNGVLIRFRLTDYNEIHDVRLPSLDARAAQVAMQQVLDQRDQLAGVTGSKSK